MKRSVRGGAARYNKVKPIYANTNFFCAGPSWSLLANALIIGPRGRHWFLITRGKKSEINKSVMKFRQQSSRELTNYASADRASKCPTLDSMRIEQVGQQIGNASEIKITQSIFGYDNSVIDCHANCTSRSYLLLPQFKLSPFRRVRETTSPTTLWLPGETSNGSVIAL